MRLSLKKTFKTALLMGALSVLGGLSTWLLVKYGATYIASKKAQAYIQAANLDATDTEQQVLEKVGRLIFENFDIVNPTTVPLLRIRPYVTNRRLPDILRLNDGVIETFLNKGKCDNVARQAGFIFEKLGYSARQWNMVSNDVGHSVLIVETPTGQQMLLDAYYGVMSRTAEGELLSPYEAQERVRQGADYKDVIQPFNKNSRDEFYRRLAKLNMAAQGDPLLLTADIPSIVNGPIVLGQLDNNASDVKEAAKSLNMTPYWQYMGHKYNRAWVRVLKAHEPVKIVMTLTQEPEEGVMIANPPPQIKGKTLSWQLQAGDELVFKDGMAKISWRRLNSYINVDQLAFIPSTTPAPLIMTPD